MFRSGILSLVHASVVRALGLVALGVIAGAVAVGPVAANVHHGSAAATVQTRATSCTGTEFQPKGYATTYGAYGTGLFRWTTGGDGSFTCNPSLPNGAVVKTVQFTVRGTNVADHQITNCRLVRTPQSVAQAGMLDVMASVPATTSMTTKRLSTSTIAFATVSNVQYAYALECQLPVDPDAVLYSADVIYAITSANG